MRNKYNHQHLQQEQQRSSTTTFLPMLCSSSSSTKQVKHSHRRSSSASSSSSVTDEPSSPKVGCMGQVKRNNKVVGFPSIISFTNTTTTTTSTTHAIIKCHDQNHYNSNSIVKYNKLKRFFSSKSLTGSPTSVIATARTTVRTAASGGHKGKHVRNNSGSFISVNNRGSDYHHGIICRSKVDESNNNSSKIIKNDDDKGSLVNLVELDPPLPVVKRQQQENEGENSLWKRRSGGTPLKTLQVKVINQSPTILLPPSCTV